MSPRSWPASSPIDSAGAGVMTTPTMSERIAEYVCGVRFDDLDLKAVAWAQEQIIYMAGVAFMGLPHPHATQALSVVRALDSVGNSTIFGQSQRARPLEAAFANCSLMRAQGLDDVMSPVAAHAGLVTMPTAFALGESLQRSGKDVLAAIITGYEVVGKIVTVDGWHFRSPRRGTIAFGGMVAAVVAARLLGLNVAQTANAIGYGADQSTGLGEGNEAQPNHNYSFINRTGIMAALAAQAGGETARTILEGQFGFYNTVVGEVPDVDAIIGKLGKDPEILRSAQKRWPGTAMNTVPVTLMLELVAAEGIRAKDVATVHLSIPEERRNFYDSYSNGPFPTRTQSTASAAFQLSIILLDGAIDLARYDQLDNPEILDLAKRIKIDLEPGHESPRWARLVVTTHDGRRFESERDHHRFEPLDGTAWLAKSGEAFVPRANLARFSELARHLERLSDFSDLMACVRPEPVR